MSSRSHGPDGSPRRSDAGHPCTVGPIMEGSAPAAKGMDSDKHGLTSLEHRSSTQTTVDWPGRPAHSYGSEGSELESLGTPDASGQSLTPIPAGFAPRQPGRGGRTPMLEASATHLGWASPDARFGVGRTTAWRYVHDMVELPQGSPRERWSLPTDICRIRAYEDDRAAGTGVPGLPG
jgi:hypothetical protein